jgi:hypothetical protein
MGQLAGTSFGIGTSNYAPLGFSPYAGQGFGYAGQGLGVSQGIGGYGIGITPLSQQVLQLAHIVPQQLQQVQYLQQQQLVHLQQLLQIVPAQLQQLQQLIQNIPQQIQQLQQQWQPFGQSLTGPLGFGLAAQPFGGQSSVVM